MQRYLTEDGSILSGEALWTIGNLQEFEAHYVQNLDTGAGIFFEKGPSATDGRASVGRLGIQGT